MSYNAARFLAAGLGTVGFGCLFVLGLRLEADKLVLLGIGAPCVVLATWINTATARSSARERTNRTDA
jgi:hypothetical protein